MTNLATNLERAQLLKLSESYRDQGYEVSLHPRLEDLPEFLKSYRPDMIARRGDEAVVVEVKSRSDLNSSSSQYLRNLAQVVEQHSDWRFELVITNSEEHEYVFKSEGSLQEHEIASQLQVAKALVRQHPESAILYSWALTDATLRIITEKEGLSLQRLNTSYLIKQLVVEGIISRSDYQFLINAFSFRNAIAHGFKTTEITADLVYRLIEITECLLKSLHSEEI
jgi:uncharacterized protein YutE (UPF0331/DUF86 family)